MGIFEEKKRKIQEIHDNINQLQNKNDSFIIDGSNIDTNGEDISKKKIYNYETDWIKLDNQISMWSTLRAGAPTFVYYLYDNDIGVTTYISNVQTVGIFHFFPQLFASKELSMREYSKIIVINSKIPTRLQPYVIYKAVFKTDVQYQNKLKWGSVNYNTFNVNYYIGEHEAELLAATQQPGLLGKQDLNKSIELESVSTEGIYTFKIATTHQGDAVFAGTLRNIYDNPIEPLRKFDYTVDLYAPPLINIYGKIIMSIVNPR